MPPCPTRGLPRPRPLGHARLLSPARRRAADRKFRRPGGEEGLPHPKAPSTTSTRRPGVAGADRLLRARRAGDRRRSLSPTPPYTASLDASRNISQVLALLRLEADPLGRPRRPPPRRRTRPARRRRPARREPKPFLTMPRACAGPARDRLVSRLLAGPRRLAPARSSPTTTSPRRPPGLRRLRRARLRPDDRRPARPRAAAEPASGLDFSLDVADEGLSNPDGRAASDIEKTVVTLPRGMTVNPSQAEGLAVCSEAQLARETRRLRARRGCPRSLQDRHGRSRNAAARRASSSGAVYVASPYENPTRLADRPLRGDPRPRARDLRQPADRRSSPTRRPASWSSSPKTSPSCPSLTSACTSAKAAAAR